MEFSHWQTATGSTALSADTTYNHIGLFHHKFIRQVHFGNVGVQAVSGAAIVAEKMHMVIVVMARFALILAECILHGVIGRGYRVNDAFIDKRLQGAIDGYPIKFFAAHFLNISMCQCTISLVEVLQNFATAFCNA